MGIREFFRPKYNPEQKVALDGFVQHISNIYSQHYDGFAVMARQLAGLQQACHRAITAGTGGRPLDHLDIEHDEQLTTARRLLTERHAVISQTLNVLREIELPNWYPDKLKKDHTERISFIEAEQKFLEDPTLESVSPPGPLVSTDEFPRIVMFFNGCNYMSSMANAVKGKMKV